MEIIQDTIRGAIKLDGLPERITFSTLREFMEQYPQFLTVEVPASVGGVLVSISQPTEDDRDKLWVRKDPSGGFVGLYLFQKGKWAKFYNEATGEIHWIVGDSENPPEGFMLITDNDALIPGYVISQLKAQYIPKTAGTGFTYYAARLGSV